MESVVKIVPQDIRFWCNHEKHMICIVLLFIIHDSIAAIDINLVKKPTWNLLDIHYWNIKKMCLLVAVILISGLVSTARVFSIFSQISKLNNIGDWTLKLKAYFSWYLKRLILNILFYILLLLLLLKSYCKTIMTQHTVRAHIV